jgi:hypothetical protein
VKLTTHLHLVLRLRMSGAMPPLPLSSQRVSEVPINIRIQKASLNPAVMKLHTNIMVPPLAEPRKTLILVVHLLNDRERLMRRDT